LEAYGTDPSPHRADGEGTHIATKCTGQDGFASDVCMQQIRFGRCAREHEPRKCACLDKYSLQGRCSLSVRMQARVLWCRTDHKHLWGSGKLHNDWVPHLPQSNLSPRSFPFSFLSYPFQPLHLVLLTPDQTRSNSTTPSPHLSKRTSANMGRYVAAPPPTVLAMHLPRNPS
jgi:hypothetical protein